MKITNDFLKLYLEYVEDTESPRVMHVWSAIAGAAACLGRRVHFEFGIDPLFANLFVTLIGPAGARKSTAIKPVARLLREYTNVRFAPDDTGGQKQGLISAMQVDDDYMEKINEALAKDAITSEAIEATTYEELAQIKLWGNIHPKDQHITFACSSDIQSFIGQHNNDLVTFLTRVYDGDPYKYKLKSSDMILEEPLLTMLAAATPISINTALPVEAIGQGLTSRMIFVYGATIYKDVPRPRPLPKALEVKIGPVFGHINQMTGMMTETEETAKVLDDLYRVVSIDDPRFIHYIDRRHTHLIKTAMCLAALRKSQIIEKEDVLQAHELLLEIEEDMPEALGEFGLSPLALAKQRLLDFVFASDDPLREQTIWNFMHNEMKKADFRQCLSDLENSGKIKLTQTDKGPAYIPILKNKRKLEFVSLLAKDNVVTFKKGGEGD